MTEPLTAEKVREIQELIGEDIDYYDFAREYGDALCAGWLEQDREIEELRRDLSEAIKLEVAAKLSGDAEVKRLREALKKYGARHLDGCSAAVPGQPCSCGFDAALAEKGGS